MFGNKKKTTEKAPVREVLNSRNQVGQGTKIEGEIICEGDIRIDGTLDGQLTSKAKVVIGPTGTVYGDIICEHADVSGKIEGTIRVKEVLYLQTSATIQGNIKTQKLVVDAGAVLNGSCSMKMDGEFSFEQQGNTNQKPSSAGQGRSAG